MTKMRMPIRRPRKTEKEKIEKGMSELTPQQQKIANLGSGYFEQEMQIMYLMQDLVEVLTGLDTAGQGQLSMSVELENKQKSPLFWRRELASRTSDYRFRFIKQLTEGDIGSFLGEGQTLHFILEKFMEELENERDVRRKQGKLLST
jgi:hypothetical protein